jgi:NAD(P)H-dependent FMN reductase
MKKITLVLGTAREGRGSEKVAQYLSLKLREKFEVTFIDVRDFLFGKTIDTTDTRVAPWRDAVVGAEALVVVSPEYNHSYPGELKILLDSLDDEYQGKLVGLVGVSQGIFSGVRAVEHLKLFFSYMEAPTFEALSVGSVTKLFDTQGNPQDDGFKTRVDAFVSDLERRLM